MEVLQPRWPAVESFQILEQAFTVLEFFFWKTAWNIILEIYEV